MDKNQTIILGGGCFWCTEAAFLRVPGVLSVKPGYAGGSKPNSTYEEVCAGDTGHAEVVKVEFDPAVVPLEKILELFFLIHDPTSLNRQGNDVGTQYRSIILYSTDEQKEFIMRYVEQIKNNYQKPLVTEVKKNDVFYEAEEYHHNYFARNLDKAYCQVVIAPKVKKIEEILENY
ncbi:MAG: peptide-methionine (S)-S-oxide reductase MsrA [Candidatus Magasanikbacteria bacterium]